MRWPLKSHLMEQHSLEILFCTVAQFIDKELMQNADKSRPQGHVGNEDQSPDPQLPIWRIPMIHIASERALSP